MKIRESDDPSLGIYADDPEALKARLVMWDEIELVPREIAVEHGYYEPGADEPPIIMPRGDVRSASDAEVVQFMATHNTKYVMQLLRLPRAVGEVLLHGSQLYGSQYDPAKPYEPIVLPYITGQYMQAREDAGSQLTVTSNLSAWHRSGRPPKVGYHIDCWENPELMITVGNAGPGQRIHCVVPEFNRDVVGGPTPPERAAFFNGKQALAMKVYGIRIDPPTETYFEVLTSHVTQFLHDGSTLGYDEPTTGFFCAVDPIPFDAYSSPLIRGDN